MTRIPAYILQAEELKAVWDDIAYLHQAGALAGVTEVIRERRRQVEHGYTPQYDNDTAAYGGLVHLVRHWAGEVINSRREGIADIGSDEDGLRQAGALAAAEIDRLNRMTGAPPEGSPGHDRDQPGA